MAELTKEEKKSKGSPRPFPSHTLEKALSVAKALQQGNKGKPWSPIMVAKQMGIKPTSSGFRDLASSSLKYGLTQGSWSADLISLSILGESLTKPTDKQVEASDRQKAVLNVEVFKKAFERLKNKPFPPPDDTYFKNVLEREFNVPRELVGECISALRENGLFAGILVDVQGSLFVTFEGRIEEEPEEGEATQEVGLKPPAAAQLPISQLTAVEPQQRPLRNQIFIIHGKNKAPLEQLKKILSEFRVPFKVAIEEPHVGRPISQKVADLMRECTSAIVIFTTDEEYIDTDGKPVYRPSDNAVYELGAASILYGNKIVVLKEENVSLPSDFSDLGHIKFEKDRLDAKAMELIKELVGFGLLTITPA